MSVGLQSPMERLAASRERLRQALAGTAQATAADPGAPAPAPGWLDQLKTLPGATLVAEVIAQWWARHPLRATVALAAGAATAVVKPVAQTHPLALVAAAFAVGVVVVWSRPWRWAFKPALFAGLLPQLLAAALRPREPTAAPGTPVDAGPGRV